MFWGLFKKRQGICREELGKSKVSSRQLYPPLLPRHLPLKALSGGYLSPAILKKRVFVPWDCMVICVRDVGSHKIDGQKAPLRTFISLKDLWEKHFYIKTNTWLCRMYNWNRLFILQRMRICLGHCSESCVAHGRCSIRWNITGLPGLASTYASAQHTHWQSGHPQTLPGPVLLVGVGSLSGKAGEARMEVTSGPSLELPECPCPSEWALHPGSMAFACQYLAIQNGANIQ